MDKCWAIKSKKVSCISTYYYPTSTDIYNNLWQLSLYDWEYVESGLREAEVTVMPNNFILYFLFWLLLSPISCILFNNKRFTLYII